LAETLPFSKVPQGLMRIVASISEKNARRRDADLALARQQRLDSHSAGLGQKYREKMAGINFNNNIAMKEFAQNQALQLSSAKNEMQLGMKKELSELAFNETFRAKEEVEKRNTIKNKDTGVQLLQLAEEEADPKIKANMQRIGKFMSETGQGSDMYKTIFPKKTISDRKAEKEFVDSQKLSTAQDYLDSVPSEKQTSPATFNKYMGMLKGASPTYRSEARQLFKDLAKTQADKKDSSEVRDARVAYRTLVNKMLSAKNKALLDQTSEEEIAGIMSTFVPDINRNADIVNSFMETQGKKPVLDSYEAITEKYTTLFGKVKELFTAGTTEEQERIKGYDTKTAINTTSKAKEAVGEKKTYSERKQELIGEGYTTEKIAEVLTNEYNQGLLEIK